MDNYYEQLVTTKKTLAYTLANAATYFFGVLGLIFGGSSGGNYGTLIIAVLLIAIAGGLFFFKKNLYVEYEYDFTNGEIDVDKIFEMKSRKRAFSFSVKNLELLAPEDSAFIKDFANKPDQVLNLFPKDNDGKVYVGMLTNGPEKAQIRFVPDERMLEHCYKYNPRAVKKNT